MKCIDKMWIQTNAYKHRLCTTVKLQVNCIAKCAADWFEAIKTTTSPLALPLEKPEAGVEKLKYSEKTCADVKTETSAQITYNKVNRQFRGWICVKP